MANLTDFPERLDDETLEEVIAFRRDSFDYHTEQGNKTQAVLHGAVLNALLELQERRKADTNSDAQPIYQVLTDGNWSDYDERLWRELYSEHSSCMFRIVYTAPVRVKDIEDSFTPTPAKDAL